MAKVLKWFAGLMLAAGLTAALPGAALAQRHHGGSFHGNYHGGYHGGYRGYHGGYYRGGGYRGGWYRGGGWGWGPAFGLGLGLGLGYPYYGGYYDYGPRCGWVPVRIWRNGYLVYRRVWRCW
jgi:hypothetical protein